MEGCEDKFLITHHVTNCGEQTVALYRSLTAFIFFGNITVLEYRTISSTKNTE